MWEERKSGHKIVVLVALSFALHGLFFALLPTLDSLALAMREAVDIEVRTIEPPPPPPPPPPVEEEAPEAEEPPPPPEPPPRRRVRRPPPTTAPPPEAPPPPPAEEPPSESPPPVRFDGVTLTNPGAGSGFAINAGSGEDFEGPVRPGRASGDPERGTAEGEGTAPPPPVDRSRPPRPPSLSAALQRNFPPGARRRGIAGVAVVSLEVQPTGEVAGVRIQRESVAGQGFGQACISTVRGSRWTPALNPAGNPIARRVNFRCEFRINY